MSTLVNKIVFHVMASDADESLRIIEIYNRSTADQKAVVDEIFLSLTRHRLRTMIERNEYEAELRSVDSSDG